MFKFGFEETNPSEETKAGANNCQHEGKCNAKPREVPFALRKSLTDEQHDAIPIGTSDLLLRKAIATAPSELSPNGADIVPSVYEGGFKLWECAVDLTEYVYGAQSTLKEKAVLELGAGHALPAIVAARAGARCVHVHDYNVEVLEHVSMPNVAANCPGHKDVVAYYAGSWEGLPELLGRTYDVVLSADTVYAEEQVDSLARCVAAVLAPGGTALIAGKAYYFGVGGGMRAFEKRLAAAGIDKGVGLNVEVVKEIRDGFSNVREILQVRRN